MILGKNVDEKSQNLHFIRFIAAIMVIFHHAFPLSGNADKEPLSVWTRRQLTLGEVAVGIFFLIGGFLIARSVDRLQSGKQFFRGRIIRIIPPLAFVTVLSMILGVFFTSYTPVRYFADLETWKYLLNSVFILVHNLPGVFTNNPYLPTVNGALWTLPVEFLCYIACFLFFKSKCFDKRKYVFTVPLVLTGVGIINMLGVKMPLIKATIRPCILFYIGIGYYVYRDVIELKLLWLLVAIVGFALTVLLKTTMLGWIVFFPYIIFTLCYGVKQISPRLGEFGNYSYGMYLWGFPVQQAVVYCITGGEGGHMDPYVNFALSVPIVFVFGWITYVITEKPLSRKRDIKLKGKYDRRETA